MKGGQTLAGDLRCMSKGTLNLEVVSRLYDFVLNLMLSCLVLGVFWLGVLGLSVEGFF